MTNWRKYNGVLIPDQPPHIEIDDSDGLIKNKISDSNTFITIKIRSPSCKKGITITNLILN